MYRYYKNDYLCGYHGCHARLEQQNGELVLTNGIAERRFILSPDFSCVGLKNLYSGEQFLRSIKPEITVTLDGIKYPVGGVAGQFEHGFLKPDWYKTFTRHDGFHYIRHETVPITRSFAWGSRDAAEHTRAFPPKGICLKVTFAAKQLPGVTVCVYYELYDNLPAFGKYFTLENHSGSVLLLNAFESELLAITEHEPNREITSSMLTHAARNLFTCSSLENQYTPNFTYTLDDEYTSQVDYNCKGFHQLVSRPQLGPHKRIADGETYESYNAHLMLFDETDDQRRTLQICRFYQTLAPWTTENPIYVHIVSNDEAVLKEAVDQCAAVGFEMMILSFGSGLDMEDTSSENISKYKRIADYAHAKGIRIGGYSLLASRHISDADDVISEAPIFGHSPCLGSAWGQQYLERVKTFLSQTGFDALEHDGSYAGDICKSNAHPGHTCYEDSLCTQLAAIEDLYHWCRTRGIYLTVPDFYFLAGNTKVCMGYKEVNWSLPREQQQILARQNIHDGTYEKLPSMGWMFVPLTEYHGGGAAATIEPLCEHLDHYRMMLNNNLLAGVQASYRGVRLYDTLQTMQMVKQSVDVYKAHRAIFESPTIHLRRADDRDWDGYLHVNPTLCEKGMLVLFNPLDKDITRTIRVPLAYTGIEKNAAFAAYGKHSVSYPIERGDIVTLTLTIPANDFIWYTIKQG